MSHLLTQCPFCQTSFKVSEEQMLAANGVVRCGACMEVFLAAQHRIVLKDKAGFFTKNDIDDNSLDEADTDVSDELDTASFEEYLSEHDDEIPGAFIEEKFAEKAGNTLEESTESVTEEVIEEPAAAIEIEDDIEEELIEEASTDEAIEEETIEARTEADDEDPDEEDPALLQNKELPDNPETTPALPTDLTDDESPDPNEVLVFAPWDDQIEQEQESHEEDESWTPEVASAETDNGETSADQSHFLNESSEGISEDNSEERSEEISEESSYNSSDQDKARGYAAFLNPSGYRMHKFSVDHVIPPQTVGEKHLDQGQEETVDQPDLAQDDNADAQTADAQISKVVQEVAQIAAPKIESLETLDSSMEPGPITETPRPLSGDENQGTADFHVDDFAETSFREDAAAMVIPTLVPDVVASEAFPASTNTPDMAWLQKVGESSAGKDADEDSDYTGAEDKAQIRSHLSALTDEDSLDPLEKENLDAIKEVPVQLLSINDPLRFWKSAGLILACAILFAGLAGQYLYYNLDALVFDNRFDRITSLLCQVTRCPDNQVIDLTNLVTQELDVRSHPSVEDALQVNFIFRNDAAREQAFPLVELNFTDISGDIIANRVFNRTEYLPPEMSLFTHMPAHSSIQVNLELVDPGEDATGYSLVFRNP